MDRSVARRGGCAAVQAVSPDDTIAKHAWARIHDPAARGHGVGKQLIDWLVAEMKAHRWSRLYWSTRETNYRARALYDQYTPHSGFLRYVINNPEA